MNAPSARGAPAHRLERGAFDEAYLDEVDAALSASPYVGESPLGPEFMMTEGFSLVFRRDALEGVGQAFPFLAAFLDKVIFSSSNAFFLNPLIMSGSSEVKPHVDCRLIEAQDLRIIPNLVSILYVRSDPNMTGGELVLGSGRTDAVSFKPLTNDLLYFKGDIVHQVTRVRSGHRRVCLVCEQYNLAPEVLEGFPRFEIITDARQFGARADAAQVEATS